VRDNRKMQNPGSILIVKLSAIGDVVHSLPVLEVLKKNFPRARIDWLIEEDAYKIVEGHPAIDNVIVSRRKSWQKAFLGGGKWKSALREIVQFANDLRSWKYDLVIDLHGLFKSGILTGLSRGKRKIGMSGATEGGWLFYNERPIPVDYNQHAIDRYLKVPEYLKCGFNNSWKGDIPIFESDRRKVNQLLDNDEFKESPLVAVNPVAKWKTKLWRTDCFAALADRLRNDLSCRIVFTGSKDDRAIIEDILSMMQTRAINLAGLTTLKELAYLYTRCKTLVTTDTGPMHIAVAMGCRVVALFGPTDPCRTGPYGGGNEVIRADVDCSPCFKKRCGHMTCMKDITVEMVFDAVKKICSRSQAQGSPKIQTVNPNVA